jgi:ABC-type Fe3+-siderophore transport system permease subunit
MSPDKLALAGFSALTMGLGILFFVSAGAATSQHKPIFFWVRGGTSMDPWQAIVAGILCLVFSLLSMRWAFRKPKE